jgi:ATP-binding cassette subfamily G (WHITE) protein 8 (sterolin 2)
MFYQVVLISCGKLMYFGKRREMLPYFAFIEYPCPAYKNPSDYYRKSINLSSLFQKIV